MTGPCVQQAYAPANACFGCGQANPQGLRLRSYEAEGGGLVAQFQPEKHHEAFPGVLNGGIIGALLDCHGNWTAAMYLMRADGAAEPPCTVTADYAVSLKRPCPTGTPLTLTAKVVSREGPKCVVEGELTSEGKVRATCRGTFVAVGPGHPGYYRADRIAGAP